MCDPVGVLEIAQRLDMPRNTVKQWHHRGKLPEPSYTVSGAPAWEWGAVVSHLAAREAERGAQVAERPVRERVRPVRHPDWEKP